MNGEELRERIHREFPDGIYLDWACTSGIKAPGCAEAVYRALCGTTSNINRGAYSKENQAGMNIFLLREQLRLFFDAPEDAVPVFTANVTQALDAAIRGSVGPEDHVIISGLEHHAVTRTLTEIGADYSVIPARQDGSADPEAFEALVRPETKAVVLNHASNISGTVNPVPGIFEKTGRHGLLRILDTAQSAGSLPVSMTKLNTDILCFTGHKGLLGPQGTGGMILTQETADRLKPFLTGGTGSESAVYTMPEFLPDKFEAGTLNLPGLAGLKASLDWIGGQDLRKIHEREMDIAQKFASAAEALPGLSIAGGTDYSGERCPVVSVIFDEAAGDPSDAAARLDEDYGIMTRSGLHCAPLAHKTLGSWPRGTVRFSFGPFTTPEEGRAATEALAQIVNRT